MLIEVVGAVLLLAGSGLVFHALLALEREPAPVVRTRIRQAPVPARRKLPRAA